MGTADSFFILPWADCLKTSLTNNGMNDVKEECVGSISCNCDFTIQT